MKQTITMTTTKEEPKKPNMIKYYLRIIRWLWIHRDERQNRQKLRRMYKEVG